VLDGRKQLHWIKFQICQILRNIPGQFPYALQNELSDFGFLRVGESAIGGEWPDNLKEEGEQRTEL
jgi:hypothetical protein